MTTISPYWEINAENTGLVLGQVQMFMWAKGICIAGHHQDGRLIAARAYATDTVYDWDSVEDIIMTEPLLADAQPIKRVWLAASRNMLIPQEWADRSVMDEWFQKLYFLEHDEELATSTHKDWNIKVIYPKKKAVRILMKQYFPEKLSRFLICPKQLLEGGRQKHQVAVLILENAYSLTFVKDGKLIHHHILDTENVTDIVSYIGNYWAAATPIEEIELLVSGIHESLSDIQEELAQFFKHTNLKHQFTIQQFLEELIKCA